MNVYIAVHSKWRDSIPQDQIANICMELPPDGVSHSLIIRRKLLDGYILAAGVPEDYHVLISELTEREARCLALAYLSKRSEFHALVHSSAPEEAVQQLIEQTLVQDSAHESITEFYGDFSKIEEIKKLLYHKSLRPGLGTRVVIYDDADETPYADEKPDIFLSGRSASKNGHTLQKGQLIIVGAILIVISLSFAFCLKKKDKIESSIDVGMPPIAAPPVGGVQVDSDTCNAPAEESGRQSLPNEEVEQPALQLTPIEEPIAAPPAGGVQVDSDTCNDPAEEGERQSLPNEEVEQPALQLTPADMPTAAL